MDFLESWLYNDIIADVSAMFEDAEITVVITYKTIGESSVNVSTGIIDDSGSSTITIGAIEGGYGAISRSRVGNIEGEREELPWRNIYFLIRQAKVANPEFIDRITRSGENFRVTNIERDTLGTHWRIEVEKT